MNRDLPAWGISLIINLSLLSIFHFVVYHQQQQQDMAITSVLDDQSMQQEMRFTEVSTSDAVGTGDGGTGGGGGGALTASLRSATAVGSSDSSLSDKVDQIVRPDLPMLSEGSLVRLGNAVGESVEVRGTGEKIAGGVQGAMDRITFEIKRSLEERKTLVIWAFDASPSQVPRRKAIADRFENVYRQLGNISNTEGLYSVVMTYGKGADLLTSEALSDVSKLTEVVRNQIVEDTSGDENVFAALKMAVDKFRTFRRSEGPWNKLVFIVTDERGDDAEQYLEDVISIAKRSQTKCFVVGNAAIFGQRHGYVQHTWKEGENEFTQYLPLEQGPESAFPDGVQMPFIGAGEDWKLRQMSSSYGPYALTRLCAETGGLYLITEESRGYAFEQAVMRNYTPDYRPVRIQEQEIKKNPAKTALVAVAGMTYEDDLPVPQLVFRGYNDGLLRNEITEAQRPVAETEFKLKRLYDALAPSEKARNSIAEPRWRAAFDLAYGRILSMRLRYLGYNQMLANMKVAIKPFEKSDSNMWRLVPSDEIATGPKMREAADQAKMLLTRVMNEHPGTPWAMLAERELATAMGWSWQEFHQDIPNMEGMSRLNDEEVARLLLAEEEERRQMQPRASTGPKAIPKL